MSFVGPALPPHLRKNEIEANDSDSGSDDTYGPALPPHLLQQKVNSKEKTPEENRHDLDFNSKPVENLDDDDDDLIGPLPPGCSTNYNAAAELEERSLKMKQNLMPSALKETETKRETWMLELPEVKAKQFGLGPRTFNRTEKPNFEGREEWTATPGSHNPSKVEDSETDSMKQYIEENRNKQFEAIVDANNKSKRKESLLKSHQKSRKRKMEQEKSQPKERVPFDRDVDLKVSKLDEAQKKAIIKQSRQLNTRFSSGGQKFL